MLKVQRNFFFSSFFSLSNKTVQSSASFQGRFLCQVTDEQENGYIKMTKC